MKKSLITKAHKPVADGNIYSNQQELPFHRQPNFYLFDVVAEIHNLQSLHSLGNLRTGKCLYILGCEEREAKLQASLETSKKESTLLQAQLKERDSL